MSGGGAQQGQAGGMQQPQMPSNFGQAAQGGMGGGFGMNNQQPMGGGMQQQLPPQMQGGMAGLLQGGGFGMGQNLQGGMPMQAPNGNFGMQSPMVGMPMGLTQQQIDKIRQQMQNEPGDTFIPQGNSQGQSFGNMLSGLSPEFRAGLLGGGLPAQVQQPALIPFNQWVQSQNQDPNVPAMTTQQLQNKYVQEMGFGTGQNLSPFNRPQVQMPFGGMPMQAVQTGMPRPPVGALPPNFVQSLSNAGMNLGSLMGDINAGQPGIPSTQGGLGSLGPMRSTPMPAAPTPPQVQTQTAPTRREPARAVQTINRAEQQAKIQGARDQMNRMRSMGVGGARDYLSQLMGRR